MSPFSSPDWLYLALRSALFKQGGEQPSYAVALPEIAELWQCSHRTASRQLVRLQDEGKLSYVPGRGRGQRSQVTFPAPLRVELEQLTAELVGRGAAAELARLFRLDFPQGWVMTDGVRRVFGMSEAAGQKDQLATTLLHSLTNLDPVHASTTTETHLLSQVFDGLTRFNAETGGAEPHLAHHWQVSDDGLTWSFVLRKGVRFHHGRLLESGDVIFTLDRVLQKAPWLLPEVRAVEAASPDRVQLHLRRPDVFLPRRLATTPALILPRDLPFGAVPAEEIRLIGTGAFRWTSVPGGVQLMAFDQYFGQRPMIDEVNLSHSAPETTKAAMGQQPLQVMGNALQDTVPPLRSPGVTFLIWNAAQPAAQNALLREAIHELCDIERFWRETHQTAPLQLAQSFLPRQAQPKGQAQPAAGKVHHPGRALTLFQESDYAGPPLRLWVLNRVQHLQQADWLIEQAAAIGLPLERQVFDWPEAPAPASPADLVLAHQSSGPDQYASFWSALTQPESIFRRLLPVALLCAIDHELDGLRAAATDAQIELVVDHLDALLLTGHHIKLTHYGGQSRAFHRAIQGVQSGVTACANFKELWVALEDSEVS